MMNEIKKKDIADLHQRCPGWFYKLTDRLVAIAAATTAAAAAATAAVATTATAATTAAAAVSAAATTAAAVFFGLGFIDGESASAVILPIEGCDRGLCFGVAAHLDESEAFASACVAIVDDLRAVHLAMGGEQLFQCGAIDVVAQISNI